MVVHVQKSGTGGPANISKSISATATGAQVTLAHLLGGTSTFALSTTFGTTNANLTLGSGAISNTAAISNGVSQTAYVRESNSTTNQALEYTVTLTGVAVPVNSVLPVITGTATVGNVMTASTGTWTNSPTGFSYQWNLGGTPISGATASTYTTTSSGSLTVSVTASNAGGSSSAATSSATTITGNPTLSALTLATPSATVNAAWSSTISGKTAGSTIAATSTDGTTITVTGNTASGTFTSTGTPTITLIETLAGATNTPRTSTLSFTVNAASSSNNAVLDFSDTTMTGIAFAIGVM